MLEITIPPIDDVWDSKRNRFSSFKGQTLQLEHSLISVSKWEAKTHKAFLETKLSTDELYEYIKCMTLTKNVDPDAYNFLTNQNILDISKYISDPMSAVPPSKKNEAHRGKDKITSELVYYWMLEAGVPFSCEKWHFNRLMTLLRIYSFKNRPKKKRSSRDIGTSNRLLNEQRLRKYNTKG